MLDSVLGVQDFTPESIARPEGETVRVAVGVILHAVPASADLGYQVGIGRRALADAEKRRPGARTLEQIQYRRRHLRIRPIVERQPDQFAMGTRSG